jgi:hypothetical protein
MYEGVRDHKIAALENNGNDNKRRQPASRRENMVMVAIDMLVTRNNCKGSQPSSSTMFGSFPT